MDQELTSAPGSLGLRDPLKTAVYEQLRTLAKHHLQQRFGRVAAGLTWQPTALANETLLRILRQSQQFNSDEHFFAVAATIMKRVIVDYIRERMAQKRASGRARVEFDPEEHGPISPSEDSILDIEGLLLALEQLTKLHPRKGEVARMRLAWGLTVSQIGELLKISEASVERDWRFARAWLKRELQPREQEPNNCILGKTTTSGQPGHNSRHR